MLEVTVQNNPKLSRILGFFSKSTEVPTTLIRQRFQVRQNISDVVRNLRKIPQFVQSGEQPQKNEDIGMPCGSIITSMHFQI